MICPITQKDCYLHHCEWFNQDYEMCCVCTVMYKLIKLSESITDK